MAFRVSRRVVVAGLAYGAGARAGQTTEPSLDAKLLNQLLAAGGVITLEPRTYIVSGPGDVLRLSRGDTVLRGVPGTVIECPTTYDGQAQTDVALLSIADRGALLSNITLEGVTFRFARPFVLRGSKPVIYAQQVRNFAMRRCAIENGTYGLYLRQVEGFSITGNTVRDTRADGIQGSNQGSRTLGMTLLDGVISDNLCVNSGDDGIAAGSVMGPGWRRAENITVTRNTIRGLKRQGGGVGIYGVDRALVADNSIESQASHAIAAVTDTNNNQHPNARISISRNDIACSGRRQAHLAAIFLANRNSDPGKLEADGPLLFDAEISQNRMRVEDRSGIWLETPARYGADRYPARIRILRNDIAFTGAPDRRFSAIRLDRAAGVTIEGNAASGFAGPWAELRQVRALTLGRNDVTGSGPLRRD